MPNPNVNLNQIMEDLVKKEREQAQKEALRKSWEEAFLNLATIAITVHYTYHSGSAKAAVITMVRARNEMEKAREEGKTPEQAINDFMVKYGLA